MAIGGKRKGAGRHPVPNKKIKKCITLRPDHIEKMAGGKASGIIEKALDKYFKGDTMEKLLKLEKEYLEKRRSTFREMKKNIADKEEYNEARRVWADENRPKFTDDEKNRLALYHEEN